MKRLLTLIGLIVISAGIFVYCVWLAPIAADILSDEAIDVDGSIRQYRLVIPHRLPLGRVPIVFAFHGMLHSGKEMAVYSGLDHLAARNGFILVYPTARNLMWATMDIDWKDLDRNPDVLFFDRLLEHLGKRFNLDRNRIYLIGMSNGASFAQLVAFVRSNVAAVAAHSGVKPTELKDAICPFPVLLLVGADDSAVTRVRSDAAEYRANGHAVELIVIPGLNHEWRPEHSRAVWDFLSKQARDRQSTGGEPTSGRVLVEKR